MRWVIYIFLVSYIFNFFDVFADKFKKGFSETNSIKWEKVKDNNLNNLKKVIWKAFNDDESYFDKDSIDQTERIKTAYQKITKNALLEIQPHIPLNNYLNYGDYIFSTSWKSAFSGGEGSGRGSGNQNIDS